MKRDNAITKLIADIDEVLTTTRAVRRRLDLDRPVDPALIEECLRLAQQATMGSNQEDWRFVAVTDQAQKERIAELYRDIWVQTVEKPLQERQPATVSRLDPGARGDEAAQRAQERTLASVKYLVDRIEQVPVLVFPCSAKPVPAEILGDRASGYYGSIFPITWSFQLALRSRGLGSVLATAIVYHRAELACILGLPEGCHPVAMVPVAHTKGLDFKPAPRLPVESILHWNRYEDG
jgi:nitroreductase